AQTSLELARLRTEQARHAALDAGLAAVRTAENAAFALELANEAVEQAQDTMALVQRRTVLGFAPPLELEEARLELLRARRDAARAEAELHLVWLELARRLGIAPRWPGWGGQPGGLRPQNGAEAWSLAHFSYIDVQVRPVVGPLGVPGRSLVGAWAAPAGVRTMARPGPHTERLRRL